MPGIDKLRVLRFLGGRRVPAGMVMMDYRRRFSIMGGTVGLNTCSCLQGLGLDSSRLRGVLRGYLMRARREVAIRVRKVHRVHCRRVIESDESVLTNTYGCRALVYVLTGSARRLSEIARVVRG